MAPGEHLIEDDAQRVEVAALAGIAIEVLWSHIKRRAKLQAGPAFNRPLLHQVRQAKVRKQQPSIPMHQQIQRLQVQMHHALRVRIAQRRTDLLQIARRLIQSQRPGPILQHVLQRATADIGHHQINEIALHANIVHMHNVGVVQRAQRARLADEAVPKLLVAKMLFQQHLDGLRATDDLVFGFVDRAKSALTQQLTQQIFAAQRLAGQRPRFQHQRILPLVNYILAYYELASNWRQYSRHRASCIALCCQAPAKKRGARRQQSINCWRRP